MSEGAFDPMNTDWFNVQTPHVRYNPQRGKPHTPHSVPGADQLYAIQDDLFDALGALDNLPTDRKSHDYRVLQHRVESAYRSIVRYLTENSEQQGGVLG